MDPRLPSLLDRPVSFGQLAPTEDRTDDDDGPRPGVELLVDLVDQGAAGVSTGIWLTADDIPALSPSGRVAGRWRRRPIGRVMADDLPPTVPTLASYYRTAGSTSPLSLDVSDPRAFDGAIAAARQAGVEADLWLCHPDVAELTSWRSRTSARLINDASRSSLGGSLERRVAELEQRGIDGLRLSHHEWSGGKTTLAHRFGRLALGTGVVYDREVAALLDAGIDGVYSDRIEPMVALLNEFYGTG